MISIYRESIFTLVILCLFIQYGNGQRIKIDEARLYADSLEVFEEIAKTSSDTLFLAGYAYLLGARYNYRDVSSGEAIEHFYKSMKLFSTLKQDAEVCLVRHQIAVISIFNENFALAKSLFGENLDYLKYNTNARLKAHTYSGMALLAEYEGRHGDRMTYLNEAIRYRKDSFLLSILYNQRGEAFFYETQYSKALSDYKRALEIARRHNETLINHSRLNIARSLRRMKMHRAALHILSQPSFRLEETAVDRTQSAIQCLKAELYAEIGAMDKAYEQLQICMDLRQELFAHEKQQEIQEQLIKFDKSRVELELKTSQQRLASQKQSLRARTTLLILSGLLIISSLFIILIIVKRNKVSAAYRKLKYEDEKRIQEYKMEKRTIDNQQKIAEAIIGGQENERQRLSRDLHDGLGGLLSSLRLAVDQMKESTQAKMQNRYEETVAILNSSLQELRSIIQNTTSLALSKRGIKDAFSDLILAYEKQTEIKLQLLIEEDLHLGQKKATMTYRIVQELVHNAIKHSQASRIEVIIAQNEFVTSITVSDDGVGFDPLIETKGAGMKNINYRVDYLGGSWEVDSKEGEGTSVFVWV